VRAPVLPRRGGTLGEAPEKERMNQEQERREPAATGQTKAEQITGEQATAGQAVAGRQPAGQDAPAAPVAETERNRDSGRYDFGDAQRLSEGQLLHFQQVHERFARELATSLSALTGRAVKASGLACNQARPNEAPPAPAQGGLLIVLDVHPLEAHATLGMDSKVVFPFLEALLGGGPAETDVSRELTEIELSVLQDLNTVVIRELERAWRPAARFTFQLMGQQTDPRSRRPSSPADGSLIATLHLEMESRSGQITLVYPLRAGRELQGAEPAPAATDAARRPEVLQQALFDRLKSAALTIEGRLQGATLTLRDLADLSAGDLLCLDIPLDQPVDMTVNHVSRLAGRLTELGRKKAIRIHEIRPGKAGRPWVR
jgi:flagellar motor switch protein FliM